MTREDAKDFMTRFAQTAIEGDHASHMAMISKKVLLHGVPGHDAIDYENWSRQCEEEFAQKLIAAIGYESMEVKLETNTLFCFETMETIEAHDGTVNSYRLEIFIERESDGEWRIVQEQILPAQTH